MSAGNGNGKKKTKTVTSALTRIIPSFSALKFKKYLFSLRTTTTVRQKLGK